MNKEEKSFFPLLILIVETNQKKIIPTIGDLPIGITFKVLKIVDELDLCFECTGHKIDASGEPCKMCKGTGKDLTNF